MFQAGPYTSSSVITEEIGTLTPNSLGNEQEMPYSKLVGLVKQHETKFKWIEDNHAKIFIHATAGEILLFFLGVQPRSNAKPSERFSVPTTDADQQINRLLKDPHFPSISKPLFVTLADRVIDNRNGQVHFGGTTRLRKAVGQAKVTFTAFPNLVQTCPDEFMIIENFDVISAYFPSKPQGAPTVTSTAASVQVHPSKKVVKSVAQSAFAKYSRPSRK